MISVDIVQKQSLFVGHFKTILQKGLNMWGHGSALQCHGNVNDNVKETDVSNHKAHKHFQASYVLNVSIYYNPSQSMWMKAMQYVIKLPTAISECLDLCCIDILWDCQTNILDRFKDNKIAH